MLEQSEYSGIGALLLLLIVSAIGRKLSLSTAHLKRPQYVIANESV